MPEDKQGESRLLGSEKITRREFLEKARKAALGAASVLVMPNLKLPEQPERSEESQEAEELSRYEILRRRIKDASGDEEQKASYLKKVTDLESNQAAIDRFVRYYESIKDSQGNPLLLSLYRRRFASLDIHVEDEIFFLKGNKWMQKINEVIDRLGTEQWDDIAQIGPQLDKINPTRPIVGGEPPGVPVGIPAYHELGQRVGQELIITSILEPNNKVAFEADKKEIREILSVLPRVQDIKVVVFAGHRYIYASPPPQRRTDGAQYLDQTGESTVEINLDNGFNERAMYVLLHETTHSLDIENNWSLHFYLQPEEIIDALILREQIMSDTKFGRNYPFVDRLFSQEMRKSFIRDPLMYAQEDLISLTNIYPDRVWIQHRDIESEFISKDYYTRVAYAARELGMFDFRRLPFVIEQMPKDKRLMTWQEFLQEVVSVMERIGQEDRQWQAVFSLLQEKAEVFNNSWWSQEPEYVNRYTPAEWWSKVYSDLTNVLLAEQFYLNNQEIIRLFSPHRANKFRERIKNFLNISDTEKFAESISYMILADQNGGIKKEDNPFNAYLELFSRIAEQRHH